jgi:hypothetical protein
MMMAPPVDDVFMTDMVLALAALWLAVPWNDDIAATAVRPTIASATIRTPRTARTRADELRGELLTGRPARLITGSDH